MLNSELKWEILDERIVPLFALTNFLLSTRLLFQYVKQPCYDYTDGEKEGTGYGKMRCLW